MSAQSENPRLLVFSQLFPSDVQPNGGLFIRERMFRVAKRLPIVVVAPQPWFPFQSVIRWFRPHFRPMAARREVQQGIEVYRPWFLCFPGVFKRTDGLLLALSSYLPVRRLVRKHRLNAIDAHFAYPDGYAATLLGRWLGLPVMITLRGKEARQSRTVVGKPLRSAMLAANRLVAVSTALKQVAVDAGVPPARVSVIGNGIDLEKFSPVARDVARRELGLSLDAKVIVSVGTLVERKGFHRVIQVLPQLLLRFPSLQYLVVGGAGPEGDMSRALRAQVASLRLNDHVHFLGPCPPERLRIPYSAADAFVLATSYEGWANVFLEAMACGLPVITTRVGGNPEVVTSEELGTLVPFGDRAALTTALTRTLERSWDHARIRTYAEQNTWDQRIDQLVGEFQLLIRESSDTVPSIAGASRGAGPLRS